MKGKLIKTDKGYILEGDNLPNPRRLSIKNCEAIELGYDLYELAEEEYFKHESNDLLYGDSENEQLAYKAGIVDGFQKALFILGDKKFSEDDIKKALEFDKFENEFNNKFYESQESFIQSLQQNEWQVEVIMDRIPADLAPDGWDVFPKLDEQNCLILKRVE